MAARAYSRKTFNGNFFEDAVLEEVRLPMPPVVVRARATAGEGTLVGEEGQIGRDIVAGGRLARPGATGAAFGLSAVPR